MLSHARSFKPMRSISLALLLVSLLAAPAAAQNRDTNQLRAAIVFNVLRFVELPDRGRGPITFCVAANDPAASSFRGFSGRSAGARTVSVRSVRAGNFSGCDVVYLGTANSQAIASASSSGRLVIGEGSRFIDRGGSVGLVQMGGQVRFEVNLEAAEESGVRMSSKLIRLAARVER